MEVLDALVLIVFIWCFIAVNECDLSVKSEDRCEVTAYVCVFYALLRFCGAL